MRLLVGFFLFIAMPLFCQAQVGDFNSIGAPSIIVEPLYPNPGTEFTIRFDDFRSSAQGSTIRWLYNGTRIAENTRELILRAPEAGQSATIKVVLESNGRTETYQTIITPLYLDLIIEPQTHVPEFYIGRALPSVGSQTRVTALLDNGRLIGNDYIYLWRINNTVFGGGPLRGQNSILFPMPHGTETVLSVQVAKPDNTIVAKRVIAIASAQPQIQWYEVNTLYGIENRALSSFNMIGNSAIFRAEPYYLDSLVFNQPDILNWSIDRTQVSSNNDNPYEITLERTGDADAALLGFRINSLYELLQGAEEDLEINL